MSSARVTVPGERLTVTMVWTCALATPLTVSPTTTPVFSPEDASSSGYNSPLHSAAGYRSSSQCCPNIFIFSPQIEPYNTENNVHRAVRLGYPKIQAHFRTVLKNLSGDVVDSRIFITDLNKGAALDWYMTLHISSPGTVMIMMVVTCDHCSYQVQPQC